MSELPSPTLEPAEEAKKEPSSQIGQKNSEFLDRLQERYDQSSREEPLAKAKEMLDLDKEEIRSLSTEDYVDYLSLLEDLHDEALILKNFDVIAERFEEDIRRNSTSQDPSEQFLVREVGNLTKAVLFNIREGKPDATLVQRLYSLINDDNRYLRHYAVEMVDDLVWRDSSGELFDRFMDDVTNHLVSADPESDGGLVTRGLLDTAWASFGEKCMFDILEKSLEKAGSEEALGKITREFSERKGVEETANWLRGIAQNPDLKQKADEAIALLFGHGGKVHDDLRDLYESIQFESYKINQEVTDFEAKLLTAKIGEGNRVLDVGAGTGRLMEPLKTRGKDVIGFDFTQRHAQLIKEKDPEAKIMLADWLNTPFQNDSFDAAYCLGRSFTHNTTYKEQIRFFQEMRRILKDDGLLIVDIPNPEKGYYQENRQKLAHKLEQAGIDYFEEGLIFDSPDGENFFTRLAPLPDQFEAIAKLGGFVVDDVVTQELPTGKGDENLYFVLRKSNQAFNPEEYLELFHQARTSGPSLRVEYL